MSSKPQTSVQNVIRNTSRTTTPMASRPFLVYRLPLGYTSPLATTYIGQMPMWYLNPLFNLMFMGMTQWGTQMAPMLIPKYAMPSMMVTSIGIMNQDPVDASVAATTIERTQPIQTDPIFPNMTRGNASI